MCNVLVGCAIGDALGVPFETMQAKNPFLKKWNGIEYLGSKHHKLMPGQYSDDTQMSLCVANSLLECREFNPTDLAQRYQEWFFEGNPRGFGHTTRIAMNALKDGAHWSESGVDGSYGNGTAMRAAPFGVFFRNDMKSLIEAVSIDSAITHNSPDAKAGAIAIAVATALAANGDTDKLLDRVFEKLPDSAIKKTVSTLDILISSDYIKPMEALRALGTSANIKETVPAALYCFLKFDRFISAAYAIIKVGGDTDTNSSIIGALYGAKYGIKHFSKYHLDNVEDSQKLTILDFQLYYGNKPAF